jgi:hypothetical protein
MLGSTPMQRAALAVAFLAATSSAATAGAYVGIGIGTNAVSEGSDRLVDDGRSARLHGGYRFKPMRFGAFAIEGSLGGYGVGLQDSTVRLMDAYQVSLAGRFNLPLGSDFEAFGRLGLQHTTVGGYMPAYDTSGTGFLVGAGIAYLFNIGIGSGAGVSIDYQISKAELSGDRFQAGTAFDVIQRQWTLGVSIGF